MDDSGGNAQRTIAHGMSKRKLTRNIGQKSISWEKTKPIKPKGTSGRALDP